MSRVRYEEAAQLDLVSVRLGSGKVYLVPRALLEGLVRAYPFVSLALVQEARVERNLLPTLGGRAWDIHHREKTDVSCPN